MTVDALATNGEWVLAIIGWPLLVVGGLVMFIGIITFLDGLEDPQPALITAAVSFFVAILGAFLLAWAYPGEWLWTVIAHWWNSKV